MISRLKACAESVWIIDPRLLQWADSSGAIWLLSRSLWINLKQNPGLFTIPPFKSSAFANILWLLSTAN